MRDGTLLAAIDLGSNSFRLEIGLLDHGQIQRMEYIKETVRQGAGLDANKNLDDAALQRGWDCLARFAERLRSFQPTQVRAVATQTLREAQNREVFTRKAQDILGFPIEVIAGREEARLIYLGVAHMLPQSQEKRLVIDIGGRSTELIIGQGYRSYVAESYPIGSVAWSLKYFPKGLLTKEAMDKARIAARALLGEASSLFPRTQWQYAYGSSGTAGAIADILHANGLMSDKDAGCITQFGLDWLRERMLKVGYADKLQMEGLREDRKPVIGGGLTVLQALFDVLELERLQVTDGALRQGVLYDLIDRELDTTDTRAATVTRLAKGFAVDAEQSRRVMASALHFYQQLQPAEAEQRGTAWRMLGWAAQLHEIGARISHNYYHKHGAYVLQHADAAGFSQEEQKRLAQLVLGHRGKLRKVSDDLSDGVFAQQLMCLRLAALVCHARRDAELDALHLRETRRGFVLSTTHSWRADHPQSQHLLQEELVQWAKTPKALLFEE